MLRGRTSRFFVCGVVCLALSVSTALAQQATKKAPPTKKAASGKAAPATKKSTTKRGYSQASSKAGFADERAIKEHQTSLRRILLGQQAWDKTAQDAVDKWYKLHTLLEFGNPANISRLPALRASMRKELKGIKSPEAAKYVKASVLDYMGRFAASANNFHPAVRYNAMLAIGDLNEAEAGTRIGPMRLAVPDPMSDAFDVLVTTFRSRDQIDAVRIAAQVGLLRHAKLDFARPPARRMTQENRTLLVGTMYQFLRSAAPTTRSPEGHTWMQRRAIEIIAALDAVGERPEVVDELQRIVADESAPRSLRCTAAEALGRWLPDSRVRFDPKTLSTNLGRIGVEAFETELALIAKILQDDELRAQIRALVSDTSGTSGTLGTGTMTGATGGMTGMADAMQMSKQMGGGGAGGGEGTDGMEGMPGMGNYSQFFGGGEEGGTEGIEGTEGEDPLLAGPQDPRVTRSRRRLKYQLACIKAGLDGIAKVKAVEPQKAEIEQVAKAIESAYKTTDPPRGDLPTLQQSLKQGLVVLAFLRPADASGLDASETLEGPAAPGPPAPAPAVPAPVAPNAEAAAPSAPAAPGEEPATSAPAPSAPAAPGEEGAATPPAPGA